jgi:predicted dehydrogenase
MVPGRVDKVSGEPWTATADDVAYFTLAMANGALTQIFMSGVAAHNIGNVTQVFGSKGTILLDNDDEKLLFAKAGGTFEDITAPDPDAQLEGLSKGIWNISVVGALRELTSAITEGRPLKQGATFFDGLANQRVLDAVKTSTRSRAWVDLPSEERP